MLRRMSRTIQRSMIGLIVIVAMMGLAIVSVHSQLGYAGDARRDVDATTARIDRLEILLTEMLNAEAGQRGYIITADPTFLDPYRTSISVLWKTMDQIHGDVAEHHSDEERYVRLRSLIQAKLNFIERTIVLRDAQGLEAAAAEISHREGKRLMDEIRAVIAQMVLHERHNLTARNNELHRREQRSRLMIDASLVGALALTFAVGLMLLQQLRARALAQHAAQQAEEQMRIAFDNVGTGIAVVDDRLRIVSRNAELKPMLPQVDDKLESELLADEIANVRNRRSFTAERDFAHGHTLVVRGTPLPNALYLLTFADVTEARRAERLKSEFVSTVSHELRTPVTSIKGSLKMLAGPLAGELPDRPRSLVDIALRNADRLALLIDDILDVEKIESGRMEFRFEPCEVNRLLEDAVEANRPYAEARGVALAIQPLSTPVEVSADSHRIQQVLANLISNAVKFSEADGVVTVAAGLSDDHAVLSVTDHGPGIPADFQSRIFERFAQADASDARAKGGTGLGLSIAKAIVEKHRGAISFSSRPGGTKFQFTLPIAESQP